jgi:hypothetical protein
MTKTEVTYTTIGSPNTTLDKALNNIYPSAGPAPMSNSYNWPPTHPAPKPTPMPYTIDTEEFDGRIDFEEVKTRIKHKYALQGMAIAILSIEYITVAKRFQTELKALMKKHKAAVIFKNGKPLFSTMTEGVLDINTELNEPYTSTKTTWGVGALGPVGNE